MTDLGELIEGIAAARGLVKKLVDTHLQAAKKDLPREKYLDLMKKPVLEYVEHFFKEESDHKVGQFVGLLTLKKIFEKYSPEDRSCCWDYLQKLGINTFQDAGKYVALFLEEKS